MGQVVLLVTEEEMWEQQLASMIDACHLDRNTKADFGVTYAAETGDSSLHESFSFLLFNAVCSGWPWAGSMSCSRVGVRVISWSWVAPLHPYWTESRLRAASTSLSHNACIGSSCSGHGTNTTSRSLSWSRRRPSCWSESCKRRTM